jgi:hypothetical protein
MLEFQEASEKALFCAPKGSHLGAARRTAKHRHEGDDEQLSEVMAGVAGASIGDIIEGG